ncbi:MAG TPA: universal stress protein, partial [Candidatus Kapabacteria bacterium]|nr:universal stress protein [Candidatus Kapabacteria bacterium]
ASADAALRFLARLRAIAPCRITVTYVSWPPDETMRYGVGGDTTNPGNTPEVKKMLERDLKEKCDVIFGDEQVEIRVVPTWTREDTKLVESAIEDQSDAIIVGTNQRIGLDRFWLGSVSRGIVRHAPMNIICVPLASVNECNVSEHAPDKTFKRVLVPVDFSESSLKAIPLALNAVQTGGEIRLLHVVKPGSGVRSQQRRIREGASAAHRKMSEKLHTLVPSATRRVKKRAEVVEHQHPSVAIFQAAERFGADLICMGSQKKKLRSLKKRLVGSTTRSVMRRSSRPVIIVQS